MEAGKGSDRIDLYYSLATEQLKQVFSSQQENMTRMASLWADAIEQDHMLYSFGSGHSRFIAGELYWRAGGLAAALSIEDPAAGAAERVEGYAETFMQTYELGPGDLLVVISNSGINAVPLEVALYGKKHGATVITLTNLEHSSRAASRHSSGKKLFEVADLVLDTGGQRGDAVVPLEGVDWHVGPTSTMISVAVLNAVVAQTAQNLIDRGVIPPALISANVAEGDEHNKQVGERYWRRLTHFPRRPLEP
ncbi:MAG: sugar isomerase domain-containing protein [Anaerolineales bacterium]|nr:sugar isomerase domain-containing protein [Anaerolineales bacterium]